MKRLPCSYVSQYICSFWQLFYIACYSQLIIKTMYINIPENSKCSKCGAKNFTEMVTRNNQTFKRCRMCGHEKIHSTLTTSSNSTEQTIYNSANYNSEDVF